MKNEVNQEYENGADWIVFGTDVVMGRAFALGCHPSKTTEIARNLSNRESQIAKDDFLYSAFA